MMHGLLRTGQVSRSFTSAATLWLGSVSCCVLFAARPCAPMGMSNEGLVLGLDLFNCRMSTLDGRRAADESGWGAEGGGQGSGAALE